VAQTSLGGSFSAFNSGLSAECDHKNFVKGKKMTILDVKNLKARFGQNLAVKGVNLKFNKNTVTAIIGPSGCGKSTFVRCLNRMHEEVPGASATGEVLFGGENIYSASVDPVQLRRRIGMVFQKPNPFPGFSIFENVAAGLKLAGIRRKALLNDVVEKSLKQAALWDEVKDKLQHPGTSLSGGQQQRLCIARALAVEPHLLLMDEPTSALDPISTAKIEDLIDELKKNVTIIIVTHNMQQAARISDQTAFFLLGDLIECGETSQIFTRPKEKQTEQYITGRFG
jgi:phosphate transport system ATP-binding protein